MSTLQSGPNQPLPSESDVPVGDEIFVEVQTKHVHSSVGMRALYDIYFSRKSIRYIARVMKLISVDRRSVVLWCRTFKTRG